MAKSNVFKNVMIPFFTAAYPKSGISWTTKIIAETLDSSIGGSCPSQDSIEPIAIKRNGRFIIRKGHYKLINNPKKRLLPSPHTLNIAKLNGEGIIHVIRDPRDIVVSAAWYHKKPVDRIIEDMINGRSYGLPKWDVYINDWLNKLADRAYFIRYEDLLNDPVSILGWCLTVDYDRDRLITAVENQSFENQKENDKHRLLRKGIAGDYKNVLSKRQIEKINSAFRETMKDWGYL